MKTKSKKRKTKKTTTKYWIFAIGIVFLFSFIIYIFSSIKTPRIVYIPQGSVFTTVSHLRSEGIRLSWIDPFILRFIGHPQHGWIDLKEEEMSRIEFLHRLTTAKAATRSITLIPGETTVVFLKELANTLSLDYQLLMKAYDHHAKLREGNFVPDTYSVPNAISEDALIQHLLEQSAMIMEKWSNEYNMRTNTPDWLQIVTKASVIQKEASSLEDMPYVSSVIDNRLEAGMRLQMDGTLNYGDFSHQKVTAQRIRTDTSPYNTYKNRGLPKYPVCNVSKDAIDAAIHPKKTNYLYFVRGKNGEHIYSSYFSTHRKNIANATK